MAEKKRNPFVWVILILLFVGLLGFGSGGFSGSVRTIGQVGDKELTVSSYQSALNDQLRALEAQLGEAVTFQQAQALGIDRAVLQQVVTRRVLDNEASALDLSVGDDRVAREVLAGRAFQGLDGQFSREAYQEVLRRLGQTEAEFETSIREDISRTLLQGAVVGGIPAPDAYADALIAFLGETRAITYAILTEDDLDAPVPGATDADIAAYYEENGADFMAPEAREITYAWITPAMIQDEMDVDEAAVREIYDARIEEFVQPERRLVERLVFIDAAAADAARARLDAGEVDFDGLVEERGLDLADVDMGDVAAEDLADSAAPAVFDAAPGDVVGPFDSALGPALFRVNVILAAEEVTFEEASEDLREELAVQRAARTIETYVEEVNDLVAGGATLEDLAERTPLELGTIRYSAESEDGIAAYDSFRAAAEAAETGAFPEVVSLSDGGLFLLRLDALTPPAQRPLDEVRDAVAEAWSARRAQELLMEQANETATRISPLTGFDTLGLPAEEARNLTRRSFVERTPPGFMEEVFAMAIAEVRVIDGGDRAIILRLDGIAPPDPESADVAAQLEAAGDAAAAGIAQDLFDAFAATVQSGTDVQIDQSVLNALNAQFQ